MTAFTLEDFVRESNRIEGIVREPLQMEIAAHENFLALDKVRVPDLEAFVEIVQPGAKLRNRVGMNVRVGSHFPPLGGRNIETELMSLLARLDKAYSHPFKTHCRYETLHPFMDGNGRSGRVLWLWHMGGISMVPLGFLHTFYYQTLGAIGR